MYQINLAEVACLEREGDGLSGGNEGVEDYLDLLNGVHLEQGRPGECRIHLGQGYSDQQYRQRGE